VTKAFEKIKTGLEDAIEYHRKPRMDQSRMFGPKSKDHPSVGKPCPACRKKFEEGDFTTLIVLGPGDNPEAQERAREGRAYNAVASEVHWTCATGLPVESPTTEKKARHNQLQRARSKGPRCKCGHARSYHSAFVGGCKGSECDCRKYAPKEGIEY
jgi:hypothetical protein